MKESLFKISCRDGNDYYVTGKTYPLAKAKLNTALEQYKSLFPGSMPLDGFILGVKTILLFLQ